MRLVAAKAWRRMAGGSVNGDGGGGEPVAHVPGRVPGTDPQRPGAAPDPVRHRARNGQRGGPETAPGAVVDAQLYVVGHHPREVRLEDRIVGRPAPVDGP